MTTNHPAHGPVSLDRLHQISEILSKAAAQSDGGNLGYAMTDAVKVINGALAVAGMDPYGYVHKDIYESCGTAGLSNDRDAYRNSDTHIALYAAPPAPVMPETLPCPVHLEPGLKFGKGVRTQCVLDALRRRADYYAELEAMTPEQRAEHDAGIAEFKAMMRHDSRAATLQGSQPVSNRDELLELIDGMEVSVDVSTCDADSGHRYFGTVTEISELETAKNGFILLVQDAKPNFKHAGNSPVTPDGWIPVSERMPEDAQWCAVNTEYGYYVQCWSECQGWLGDEISLPSCDVTHWIPLPAAPQQEVNRG